MKICLLTKSFPPRTGGGETYAYELSNALGERGHNIDVYTQQIPKKHNKLEEINDNVTLHRITKSRKYLVVLETIYYSVFARKNIDFSQYDIIHGTLMPASTVALTLKRGLPDVPIVVTSHGTSIGEFKSHLAKTPADYLLKYVFHPTNVFFDYITGHCMDHIIAISDHAYDQLTKKYRFNSEKTSLIPHGVDTSKFHPEVEISPEINSNKLSILYVGRLAPRKGLDLAFKSIAELKEIDIEFIIAGEGRHKQRLKKLAQNLGILDRIQFLGYVSEKKLPSLYATADIFLLPSRYEGYGLVLLESMACGTPAIAADVGGIPTVIDHKQNGLLVQRKKDCMKSNIKQLCSDNHYLRQLGKNGRKKALRLDWMQIGKQVEKLYNDII
jgi:glycosyltransferase involved in cell wall biosynthesis